MTSVLHPVQPVATQNGVKHVPIEKPPIPRLKEYPITAEIREVEAVESESRTEIVVAQSADYNGLRTEQERAARKVEAELACRLASSAELALRITQQSRTIAEATDRSADVHESSPSERSPSSGGVPSLHARGSERADALGDDPHLKPNDDAVAAETAELDRRKAAADRAAKRAATFDAIPLRTYVPVRPVNLNQDVSSSVSPAQSRYLDTSADGQRVATVAGEATNSAVGETTPPTSLAASQVTDGLAIVADLNGASHRSTTGMANGLPKALIDHQPLSEKPSKGTPPLQMPLNHSRRSPPPQGSDPERPTAVVTAQQPNGSSVHERSANSSQIQQNDRGSARSSPAPNKSLQSSARVSAEPQDPDAATNGNSVKPSLISAAVRALKASALIGANGPVAKGTWTEGGPSAVNKTPTIPAVSYEAAPLVESIDFAGRALQATAELRNAARQVADPLTDKLARGGLLPRIGTKSASDTVPVVLSDDDLSCAQRVLNDDGPLAASLASSGKVVSSGSLEHRKGRNLCVDLGGVVHGGRLTPTPRDEMRESLLERRTGLEPAQGSSPASSTIASVPMGMHSAVSMAFGLSLAAPPALAPSTANPPHESSATVGTEDGRGTAPRPHEPPRTAEEGEDVSLANRLRARLVAAAASRGVEVSPHPTPRNAGLLAQTPRPMMFALLAEQQLQQALNRATDVVVPPVPLHPPRPFVGTPRNRGSEFLAPTPRAAAAAAVASARIQASSSPTPVIDTESTRRSPVPPPAPYGGSAFTVPRALMTPRHIDGVVNEPTIVTRRPSVEAVIASAAAADTTATSGAELGLVSADQSLPALPRDFEPRNSGGDGAVAAEVALTALADCATLVTSFVCPDSNASDLVLPGRFIVSVTGSPFQVQSRAPERRGLAGIQFIPSPLPTIADKTALVTANALPDAPSLREGMSLASGESRSSERSLQPPLARDLSSELAVAVPRGHDDRSSTNASSSGGADAAVDVVMLPPAAINIRTQADVVAEAAVVSEGQQHRDTVTPTIAVPEVLISVEPPSIPARYDGESSDLQSARPSVSSVASVSRLPAPSPSVRFGAMFPQCAPSDALAIRSEMRRSEPLQWLRRRHGAASVAAAAVPLSFGVLVDLQLIAESAIPQSHPLGIAASLGWTLAVQRMLTVHASPNVSAPSGVPALHAAAAAAHIKVLDVLLRAHADPDLPDTTGETALWVAARGGHTDAVRTLILHGADVEACDQEGRTLVCALAADVRATNAVSMLKELVRAGARLEARDRMGSTPLHVAVRARNHPVLV